MFHPESWFQREFGGGPDANGWESNRISKV